MTVGVDSSRSGRARPVRTCVGCRGRAVTTELLRLVVERVSPTGLGTVRVVPDLAGRLPGRGAWLHPLPDCLDLAERRRVFARAFRLAGPFDLDEVRRYLEQQAGAAARAAEPTSTTSTTSTTSSLTGDRPPVTEGGDQAMSAR